MKIAAIISEYNPFHNGHAYQIEKTKKELHADYVIAIMSGHFVQRGEPAIFDKWTRTHLALRGGADVVIELPTLYSTASAELFATGSIRLLHELNSVHTLSFGSEEGNLDGLLTLANLFLHETDVFKKHLKQGLKQGYSFPKARQYATEKIYPKHAHLLKGSNNILAIEYLKALIKFRSPITPFTVQRVGSSYLDTTIQSKYASATALRLALRNTPNSLIPTIPSRCTDYLFSELDQSIHPIYPDDCYPYYQYLLTSNTSMLCDIYDFPKNLKYRLQKLAQTEADYTQFLKKAQSKNYTKTTVQRALLHSFLNIKTSKIENYTHQGLHHYIRLLGFKKNASPVLSLIKKQAQLPLLTNVADASKVLTGPGQAMLQDEIRYTHLYNNLILQKKHKSKKNDYTQPIIIL